MLNQEGDIRGTLEKRESLLSHVDHTLLKAVADWPSIKKLCEEAIAYRTASVCIPPSYVERVHSAFPNLTICTVVGFPLGYHTTEVKVFEAKQALAQGASEIDMVINLCDVKNGDFTKITNEIRAVKQVCSSHILKVIIETCYLTTEEKYSLCDCVTAGGADYIKTSTGFGDGGAMVEDVILMKKSIGSNVKIKAAGGIRTAEDINQFLSLGCDRIGSSRAVEALCSDGEV